MQRVAFSAIEIRSSRFASWARPLRRVLFGLFVVQFALVWSRLWLAPSLLGNARWPEGLLVVLATATTLASLARQLPGQNVMLASVVIVVSAGAVQTLDAFLSIPFGGCHYHVDRIGPKLFEPLPWAAPVIWLVAILNSRGVARLILRPWRKTRTYGFWVMGITVLLVVLFDVGLEPFATRVKQYWQWDWARARLPVDWYGTPLTTFLGWAVTSLIILAFVTPALINKKPVKHPPDYQPLALWVMLNVLFLTGSAAQHLWLAAGVTAIVAATVAVFAVHGGRW